MTELEKYQAVNQCETAEELGNVISKLADSEGKIQGRVEKFDSITMLIGLEMYMEDRMYPNILTREYGIRQQAMYLKYYTKS